MYSTLLLFRRLRPFLHTTPLRCTLTTNVTTNIPPLSTEQLLLRATAGDPTYTARTLIQIGNKSNPDSLIPHTATQSVCDAYRAYDNDILRTKFLVTLAKDMYIDEGNLTSALNAASKMSENTPPERVRRVVSNLRTTLTPAYETLFTRVLAQVPDGMNFLVDMRGDLLRNIRLLQKKKQKLKKKAGDNHKASADSGDKGEDSDKDILNETNENIRYLNDLDTNLKRNMIEWFSMSFLKLERVTMEMPGTILDQIIQEEKVHPITSFNQLKLRLGKGRRCYAFFHPSLPKIPLAFVHVALLDEIADNMNIITGDVPTTIDENDANCAIFYSISSSQPGLSGVDLGNFLIKQVANDISETLPNIKEYSTLSPIPNFSNWVKSTGINLLQNGSIPGISTQDSRQLITLLKKHDHFINASECNNEIQNIFGKVCGYYLYHEKLRGRMICPVGNFHVRNGAEAWRLNVSGGDSSKHGIKNSYGIMMNYKYILKNVEKNNEKYVLEGYIKTGQSFDQWLHRAQPDFTGRF
jgi:malonyl-CoA decarboxylase